MFCQKCGAQLGGQESCSTCDYEKPKHMLKLVRLVANMFFPGLGHIVAGQKLRGSRLVVIYLLSLASVVIINMHQQFLLELFMHPYVMSIIPMWRILLVAGLSIFVYLFSLVASLVDSLEHSSLEFSKIIKGEGILVIVAAILFFTEAFLLLQSLGSGLGMNW